MFCIGAIFKNEEPYILEWIAYHQSIGVNRFYIVDNISSDGSSELLCALHSLGIITRIEYKNESGVKPQLPAYRMIIKELKDDDELIAFIDADEFIHFNDPSEGVNAIKNIFADRDIGAVALNWAIYGSSKCIVPRHDSLVIERFDHRAPQDFPANNHYKSVVRKSSLIDTCDTAHFFKINGNYVLTDLTEVDKLTGLSVKVSWDICRINHYVVKSKSEFFAKKAARGRPSGKDSDLNGKFFNNHDINSIREQYPYSFISNVKNNIATLEQSLSINKSHSKNHALYQSEYNSGTCCVDNVTNSDGVIIITGWAVSKSKRSLYDIRILINNENYMNDCLYIKTERLDVFEQNISNDTDCGFTISIDTKKIFVAGVKSISIHALDNINNSVCELNLVKYKDTLASALPNLL